MDTPQEPLPVAAEQSPIKQWWEQAKGSFAAAVDVHTQGTGSIWSGNGYSFCSCCGAKVHFPTDGKTNWVREYLHVGLRMTADQLKEKLMVVNDPAVVQYEIHHDGVPFSFLWKDE